MNMMLSLLEEKIKTSKFNYLEALYLMNEFTFGFELEGWTIESKREFENYASDFFTKLESKLPQHKKTINTSTMELGEDSTIEPNEEDIECSNCEGTGFVSCEHCEGEGKIECEECNGSGEIEVDGKKCEFCKGTGHDLNYEKGLFNDKITCPECNGEGANYRIEVCPECNGEGHENCHTCDGDGKMKCPFCYNGKVDMEAYKYEWKSPIFNFNMENINNVIKFLYSSIEYGYLRTNNSCGFHVHIGLPDKLLLNENRLWILIKLALKDGGEFVNKFFVYKTPFGNIEFTDSTYASKDIITNIQMYASNVSDIDDIYVVIQKGYDDEKFTFLGQHPQGTLEWRGPRGFLDTQDKGVIKGFFLTMLYPIVKFFNDTLEEEELTINNVTISKKDFNLYVRETLGYKVPIINKRRLEDRRFDWEGQKKYSNMQYINEVLKSNKWLLKQETHFTNMLIKKDDEKYLMSDGSFRNSIIESSNNLIFDNVSFSYNCNLHQNFYNQIDVDDECYILDGNFINSSIHDSKIMNGNFEGCTFQYRPYTDNTCLIKDGTFVNCLFCFSSKNNINNLYTYYNGFKNVKNSELLLKGSSPSNINNHIKIPNNIQNINDIILFISDALKQIPINNKNNKKNEIMNYRNIELDESFYDYLYELYNI